jgi:predicted Zn-dependent protease
VSTQRYNADRADARTNLGNFFAERGDFANAEQELLAATRVDPLFTPAWVNLADVYRALRRDMDSEQLLLNALVRAPRSAVLHHARGLALARLNRAPEAIVELRQAVVLEPDNSNFAYGYAVALHSSGRVREAIASLERVSARRPNDEALLSALASMRQNAQGIARGRGGMERRR